LPLNAHGGQGPPQSTSVSSLSLKKLSRKAKEGASVGDTAGVGVGDLGLFVGSVVGLSVGCTVGGGFVGKSVAASVALENHSEQTYDEHKLPLSLNKGPMDDQSEAHDEYRLLSLDGTIDEHEYTVLSLNEPVETIEQMEPIELKEHIEHIELKEPIENKNQELMEPMEEPIGKPIEPIELKESIEGNPEAYDE
jgi:hypothetical protein